MRILTVEPGPSFSVADVHQGWRRAFADLGHQVVNYNLGDRLSFYHAAHLPDGDGYRKAFPDEAVANGMAMLGVESAVLRWRPELVVFTTGYYVNRETIELFRNRGCRVAILFTESPYEDDRQLELAPFTDLNVVNDPTNLDTYRMVQPNSVYLPHAYDPAIHHPGSADPDLECDVSFVGTGFPSRVEFLEAVDWSGIRFHLAGSWGSLREGSPLRRHLIHGIDECWPNDQTADLYRSSTMSFNLYRREANHHDLTEGWAMGPREIELAATGTFFMRDPRPESDDVFDMLPAFTSPAEFERKVRWWLTHDMERREAARMARDAVAGWTFQQRAEQLLALI